MQYVPLLCFVECWMLIDRLQGVRIYDTSTSQRITYISRSADSPRADLFKLTLHWSNPTTLLIGWADYIKIAKIKEREPRRGGVVGGLTTSLSGTKEVYVEIEKIFQVDCMISGIVDYGKKDYLILAYPTEEEEEEGVEVDPYKRKEGSRPELRIISSEGKELSSDALSLKGFEKFSCRDYSLSLAPPPAPSPTPLPPTGKKLKPLYEPTFYITSPKEIIVSKPRDEEDHINWLIEQKQYKNALDALEKTWDGKLVERFDLTEIGRKYLQALVEDGSCPASTVVVSVFTAVASRSVHESGGELQADFGVQCEALGGLDLPLRRKRTDGGECYSTLMSSIKN